MYVCLLLFLLPVADLVLPAWVGVAFHGTWTALLAAEVIIIGLPDDCQGRHMATSSVLWLLISFALTTLLQCVVAGISMRGENPALLRAGMTCLQASRQAAAAGRQASGQAGRQDVQLPTTADSSQATAKLVLGQVQ